MLFNKNKKNRCLLGLDLTNTTIKLLELSKTHQGYQVENYATAQLNPHDAAIETLLQQNTSTLTKALSEQINLSQFHTRNIAIALADTNIMNKVVRFDQSCTKAEIENQIASDYMKYFAPTSEPINYDYYIIGNSQQLTDSIDVWVVGIKQLLVNNCVAAINDSKLQIHNLDLASLAIARACKLIPSISKLIDNKHLYAVLNFNKQQVSLIIYNQYVPLMTRTVILEPACDDKSNPNNSDSDLSAITLSDHLQNTITHQMQQVFDSFHATYQLNSIKQLFICGVISNSLALSEHLIAKFNISCDVANPFSNMSIADCCDSQLLLQQAHQWMICCGLAMRMRD